MKYYLAGPMHGYDKLNFPAFDEAAKHLRQCGYEIVSPHELDSEDVRAKAMESTGEYVGAETWGDFLARDVKNVADYANGIIFLPGWENSKGARLEAYVGLLANHPFFEYSNTPDEGVVLTELPQQLVAGVCAAAWCPREILKKLGLLDA